MHATLLTALLIASAQHSPVFDQQQPTIPAEDWHCRSCNKCDCRASCRNWPVVRSCSGVCCRCAPRACCGPRLGCCPGSYRYMRYYPTVHGYYPSLGYNYRHLFDYPWHAAPPASQGFFTLFGGGPPREEVPAPYPEPEGVLSEPLSPVPGSP